MSDKRSQTSRANLGKHATEPLSPNGSTVISLRIPNDILPRIDKYRGSRTRSKYIRKLLLDALPK